MGPYSVAHDTVRLVRKRQRPYDEVNMYLSWEWRRPASSCRVAGLRVVLHGGQRGACSRRRRTSCGPSRSLCARTAHDLGGRWSWLGAHRQVYRHTQQAGRRHAGQIVKMQAGGAGGGDVQAIGLFGRALEDVVEDAGRADFRRVQGRPG